MALKHFWNHDHSKLSCLVLYPCRHLCLINKAVKKQRYSTVAQRQYNTILMPYTNRLRKKMCGMIK